MSITRELNPAALDADASTNEEQLYKTQKHLNKLGQAEAASHAAGSAMITSIFAMFMATSARVFLENIGKFFLFSGIALVDVIVTAESGVEVWYRNKIDKLTPQSKKREIQGDLQRAVVKLVANIIFTIPVVLAVVASLVGAFIGLALIAKFSTIIFAAILSAKAVFNGVASIHYFRLSNKKENADRKDKLRQIAKNHLLGFAITALIAPVILPVMKFKIFLSAPVAIVGGVLGVVGALNGIRKMRAQYKQLKTRELEEAPLLNNRDNNFEKYDNDDNDKKGKKELVPLNAEKTVNAALKTDAESSLDNQGEEKPEIQQPEIKPTEFKPNPNPNPNPNEKGNLITLWYEKKEAQKNNGKMQANISVNLFATPVTVPEKVIEDNIDNRPAIAASA